MRLYDESTKLELQIAGYQWPNQETADQPADAASWDSNWLVIEGAVQASDGKRWSFQDPSLTTWEVGRLSDWLQQIAEVATTATAPVEEASAAESPDVDERAPKWLTFTEPNLSFAVGKQSESQVELLIGLSHEAAAPSIDPESPKRTQVAIVTRACLLYWRSHVRIALSTTAAR
ncbi:hypothetical protein [Brevibacterium antiquum]|uniref:Uncharacterized protein n=1 Tax=Brevibacterium antiquum TaxID=234835 RepID=A0A2H1JMN2_9MICO|nr:hypothetical protein [Brevibacterium antiquum]SMX88720.1 hypothetical protein BANT10_02171 [Brevibacterium antiquum]